MTRQCWDDYGEGNFGPCPESPTEVRVTDPVTGGQKGQKDVQLSMLPVPFLEDLGRVYAMGARKYTRDNWRRGYAWSLSYDAMLRHLLATMRGEWYDEESGLPHMAHVAWHCATLHTFYREGLGTDDRTVDEIAGAAPALEQGGGPGTPSARSWSPLLESFNT